MGLSQVAVEGRKVGGSDRDVNAFTVKAAFSTLTNVDFDPDRFILGFSYVGVRHSGVFAESKYFLGSQL